MLSRKLRVPDFSGLGNARSLVILSPIAGPMHERASRSIGLSERPCPASRRSFWFDSRAPGSDAFVHMQIRGAYDDAVIPMTELTVRYTFSIYRRRVGEVVPNNNDADRFRSDALRIANAETIPMIISAERCWLVRRRLTSTDVWRT